VHRGVFRHAAHPETWQQSLLAAPSPPAPMPWSRTRPRPRCGVSTGCGGRARRMRRST
jgi:hypothetical protein